MSESQFLEIILQAEEKELPGKILLFAQLSGYRPGELFRMLQEVYNH